MTHEDALAALTHTTNWHKASYSQAENGCVEIGRIPGFAGVRDTKLGAAGPILVFPDAALAAFTTLLRG